MRASKAIVMTLATLASSAFGSSSAATLTFQQGENGYTGTSDTTLKSSAPAVVADPGDASIDASDYGSPDHVLLRFDDLFGTADGQIRSSDAIVHAQLQLSIVSAGSGIVFDDMLVPWSQTTATWNSFRGGIQTDGIEASTAAFASIGANNGDPNIPEGLFTVDVTASLQAVHSGALPGYGWALLPFMPNGTNGVDFVSSEQLPIELRPLLTVEVAPVPEPETYALLLAGLTLIGAAQRRGKRKIPGVAPC
jgi:hypothetical protein